MSEKEIVVEAVAGKILMVRGRKVMLDRDLAELYGVKTRDLNKAVERNRDRFPDDFMYQLTKEEVANLKFQFGTSSWGGTRKLPNVFTEQGVAMLSGVLHSKRAVQVNIAIMRAFVRMRDILLTNKDLAVKIETLELKYKNHDLKLSEYDTHIGAIFEAIKQLMSPPSVPEKPKIGFHQ
ncbi:MAG: ORF6N domain-containing protein [Candidatus Omnitrophota bacterium]|nr:ORF6N domain-containing protein [Candidatus Omnitrophota bacterium]